MMKHPLDSIRPIKWRHDQLHLLDQRLLPEQEKYLCLSKVDDVAGAIRDMVVRGAPAIGITAAYGVVLAAREHFNRSPTSWKQDIQEDLRLLCNARPTAINPFWAIERMKGLFGRLGSVSPEQALLEEAKRIHQEDINANYRIGDLGADLIQSPATVLTHCNAGALATGGYGTALGVIRSAYNNGLIKSVYADETRPWLQGSRLTAWELIKDGIAVNLLTDGAAAYLMAKIGVDWLIVGSDRIAANGDVANKIGTYSAAVVAKYHGAKVMVAAPTSTIDWNVSQGAQIPIEQRVPEEVLHFRDSPVAANGARAWNPVFDITPAALVDAIVTEKGVITNPTSEKMISLLD